MVHVDGSGLRQVTAVMAACKHCRLGRLHGSKEGLAGLQVCTVKLVGSACSSGQACWDAKPLWLFIWGTRSRSRFSRSSAERGACGGELCWSSKGHTATQCQEK